MTPIVEIVYIPASEAYQKNPSLLNGVCKFTKEAGCLGAYHGLEVDDNHMLVLIIVWNSVGAHRDLMNDTVIYPQLQEVMKSCVKGGSLSVLDMFHAELKASPAPALNAPVTSLVHVTEPSMGKSFTDLEPHFRQITSANDAQGAHGGAYGKVVERSEYVLLTGWDSPDVIVDAALALNAPQSDGTAKHVKLITYFKYEG